MTRAEEIIQSIRRKNPWLKESDPVGVVGSFCKTAESDKAKGNNDIIVVANTDDIDLEDEVVRPSGLDGRRYFYKNAKLFIDHNYDFGSGVAAFRSAIPMRGTTKMAEPGEDQTGWRVRARVVANTQFAGDLMTWVDSGEGVGSSIGFKPDDWGQPTDAETRRYSKGAKRPRSIVRTSDWLELSYTLMPMNVACQTGKSMEMADTDRLLGKLDEMLTKSQVSRVFASAFGLGTIRPARSVHPVDSRPKRVVRLT